MNGEVPLRIAVLGAGHVGTVIARLAGQAGYSVSVATSGDPEEIALTIQVLAPGAEPRKAADAVAGADIVIVAIPLHEFKRLDPDLLTGKVVVDMMNYWPAVNGYLESFARKDLTSSEIVARRLAGSRVVKTLNHLGYHQLDEESRPAADPERRALGVAGDDPAAVELVAGFVERIGFDAVRIGDLHAGRLLEPDGFVFGRPLNRAEFARALGILAA
ncbi:MAG TPA: NAD(P)-binding domain-containing protein [Candidatus Dormibacteraeota bacterium]|nr:NAD(P)-binding domain-containing protein [Candidatus Dormibacteraeota bacterium]